MAIVDDFADINVRMNCIKNTENYNIHLYSMLEVGDKTDLEDGEHIIYPMQGSSLDVGASSMKHHLIHKYEVKDGIVISCEPYV